MELQAKSMRLLSAHCKDRAKAGQFAHPHAPVAHSRSLPIMTFAQIISSSQRALLRIQVPEVSSFSLVRSMRSIERRSFDI